MGTLLITLLSLLMLSSKTHALILDLNVFYATDSVTSSSTVSHNRTLYDAALGIALDKKGRYYVGWSYASIGLADSESATTSLTATDMGLRLGGFFNKSKAASWALTYNLISTTTYQAGSSAAEEWRGSSIMANLGYHIWFGDTTSMALRLNYYSLTPTERITSGTTLSDVSYSANFIYPSIGFLFSF